MRGDDDRVLARAASRRGRRLDADAEAAGMVRHPRDQRAPAAAEVVGLGRQAGGAAQALLDERGGERARGRGGRWRRPRNGPRPPRRARRPAHSPRYGSPGRRGRGCGGAASGCRAGEAGAGCRGGRSAGGRPPGGAAGRAERAARAAGARPSAGPRCRGRAGRHWRGTGRRWSGRGRRGCGAPRGG